MRRGYVLAAIVAATCGCKAEGTRPSNSHETQTVLARVDNTIITARDLDDLLGRYSHAPFVLARYSGLEKRKSLLESIVTHELLAQEARRRGYERDPDVQRLAKSQLVAELEKREIYDKIKPEELPAPEVESYYREHAQDFKSPEEVRISHILVHNEDRAREVLAEARSDAKHFRALVERYSEDEDSKPRGGDLMFFDRSTSHLPKPLVEASFAIAQVGGVAGPVRTERGLHIIMLTDRRKGAIRPLADIEGDVRRRLAEQRRAQRRRELIEEARKTVKVEIYEDQLARLDVVGGRQPGQPPTAAAPALPATTSAPPSHP